MTEINCVCLIHMLPDEINQCHLSSCEVLEIEQQPDPEIEGLLYWYHPNGIIEMLSEYGHKEGVYKVSCYVTQQFYQDSYSREWNSELTYSNITITQK